jgi:mRNA interferase MazF
MAAAPARAKPKYVPDAGDIVWLEFNHQAGHEQAGHRPAVVLSPASYNGRTGRLLCCPTTTQIKNYPFEVGLSGTKPSVALADQIKSLDWQARHAIRKGRATTAELDEIRQKAMALLHG